MDINKMTAIETGKKIKEGKLSCQEAATAVFERIEQCDRNINAYISTCKKQALQDAGKIQKKITDGELTSPLAGVPVAVKDNICTAGIPTTCASKMLQNFIPTYDATIIRKLKEAGAIIIGKLNMDEFSMGSTTESSYYGVCKNPWDTARVSGGSSGGSAASIAAGEAFYAIGTDTGGSIRQPASFCGVTGIKPTYGAVSRFGIVAFASSLDQAGVLGQDAADVAAALDIISGKCAYDSVTFNQSINGCFEALTGNIKDMKIGIPTEFFSEGLEPDIRDRVLSAADTLRKLGAKVEECAIPSLKYSVPTYYIVACAEATSNLSRYDGVKYGYRSCDNEDLTDLYYKTRTEGFGLEVKRRLMIGNFVLSSGFYDAYYKKALQVKAVIKKDFDRLFSSYDALLSPVYPTTATKIGHNIDDPVKVYLADIYTSPVNLAGLPGISAPCGFDRNHLPVGMQLIGNSFSEKKLLNLVYAFQQATDFHNARPEV